VSGGANGPSGEMGRGVMAGRGVMERVAGAPITWGVDGSPGWGSLMAPDRVLAEMAEIGLRATESGPDGFLPDDPDELGAALEERGLKLIGGFVPALLYRADRAEEQLARVERASKALAGCGSTILVLGPSTHHVGYDTSVEMSEGEWEIFLTNLRRAQAVAGDHGLALALHQHWGMAVERPHHLDRLLEESDVELCLDTGHLHLGGADPAATARAARGRVAHVHLKDVDAEKAEQVRSGDLAFRRAVIDGLFRPLGRGAIDIEGFIGELESSGYEGWYVLEQDVALAEIPPEGAGPISDARRSVEYLRTITGFPPQGGESRPTGSGP